MASFGAYQNLSEKVSLVHSSLLYLILFIPAVSIFGIFDPFNNLATNSTKILTTQKWDPASHLSRPKAMG